MKSARNAGPLLMLATALAVMLVAAPAAAIGLPLSAGQLRSATVADANLTTVARKGCKFGQRFSTYYRRCVLWTPFDYA
jgi:hypothetical protein